MIGTSVIVDKMMEACVMTREGFIALVVLAMLGAAWNVFWMLVLSKENGGWSRETKMRIGRAIITVITFIPCFFVAWCHEGSDVS